MESARVARPGMAMSGWTASSVEMTFVVVVSYYRCSGWSMGAQNQAGEQAIVQESKSYWALAETPAEASVGLVEPWRPSWVVSRLVVNERPQTCVAEATWV